MKSPGRRYVLELDRAIKECKRWFAYLDGERNKSKQLQQLAKESIQGLIDEVQARQRLRKIDSERNVYNGANLEHAVKVLLRHLEGK